MSVVDSSALVEFLAGDVSYSDLSPGGEPLAASSVVDYEVLSTLRGLEHAGKISHERAGIALDHYRSMRIDRYDAEPLLLRIWALRHNFTSYDASYIALAEVLHTPLVTCDKKMLGPHQARLLLLR